ncbi:MAG: hypothetical protein OEU26_15380, partial [Candidatus Tectomicrobia bacterium]|nr:hypothetical protein [Candidatus Tectomicrobia bacterium]
VVTPHPSVWRQVNQAVADDGSPREEDFHRLLTGHSWRCLSPDYLGSWDRSIGWLAGGVCRGIARHLSIEREIGWYKAAQQTLASLTPDHADVILATGSPFLAFRLAQELSERLGRPYVMDYRDLWTGNLHLARTVRASTIREEARLLAGSAAVTVVSPSWGAILDQKFGVGAKLHVVSNGYAPDEMQQVEPYDFDHFAIVYTGAFYPPKRVITPVMAALKHLQDAAEAPLPEWRFHYYGHFDAHVDAMARQFGVRDRVILHGNLPRSEVLSAVQGAGVSVVITSVTEAFSLVDNGMITGKMFEALGLDTPVMLIAPPGSDAAALVDATKAGRGFLASETRDMADFLRTLMAGTELQMDGVSAYAWPHLAQSLDVVLHEAMGKRIVTRAV